MKNKNPENTKIAENKEKNAPPTAPPSKEEYLFIRAEILQYMNNYQSVRNMMYVATLSCLGLSVGNNIDNPYLYLLPLIAIIPSFLVAVNFWKCVLVDSAYLKVFHEELKSEFKWETRHDNLFTANQKLEDKVNVQHVPYIVCAISSFALFGYKAWKSQDSFAYIAGAVVLVICIIIFAYYWRLDKKNIEAGWEKVKQQEESGKKDTEQKSVHDET